MGDMLHRLLMNTPATSRRWTSSATIDRIHAQGAEVLMSSHIAEALTGDAVLGHLLDFQTRR